MKRPIVFIAVVLFGSGAAKLSRVQFSSVTMHVAHCSSLGCSIAKQDSA
jgi:hypothetical protein